MTGIQDGYFGPYWGMTRAMVATILYRMAGAPAVADAQTSFEDVDAAAWYGPAVAWAKEKGMINGYSPTQFAPDDYITREQMAALLWRYAGSPAPTQALTATDQDSISDWACTKQTRSKQQTHRFTPLPALGRGAFCCPGTLLVRMLKTSTGKSGECYNLTVDFSGHPAKMYVTEQFRSKQFGTKQQKKGSPCPVTSRWSVSWGVRSRS